MARYHGWIERIGRVQDHIALRYRPIPIGVRFVEYDRGPDDKPIETGRVSKVYGGMLDSSTGRYTGEPPTEYWDYPCHAGQLDYVEDDSMISLALGGRGGGKSEAARLKALRYIAEMPGLDGLIIAPTYDLGRNVFYHKIIPAIPREWVAYKNKMEREVILITGTVLRLRTARSIDGLRSFGAGWALFDEDQAIDDEAHDIVWPTLRETAHPRLFGAATPKMGMFKDRVDNYKKDKDSAVFTFPSYSNVFIPRVVFDKAKELMDPARYAQEIEARFVALEGTVYHTFIRSDHAKDLDRYVATADATRQVATRWVDRADWLIGLDYNIKPMAAVVCKVLTSSKGDNLLYVYDNVVIDDNADPWMMAAKLKEKGYAPGIIFDDASGDYSAGGKAASKVMRNAGFTVIHPRKNPRIKDRVNAVRAMLRTQDGRIRLFIHPRRSARLRTAFEGQTFDSNGKPDKKGGFDHILDALGYLVHQVWPPYKWKTPAAEEIAA